MKKLFSFLSLKTAFVKGVRKGSAPWKLWFFVVIIFRILKWLFAKPTPTKINEYDLEPGEYKIVVREDSKASS